MNFDVSEAERAVADRVVALFDPPLLEKVTALGGGAPEDDDRVLRHCLQILGASGYLGLHPGVDGTTAVQLVCAQEALAAVSPALCLCAESSARLFGRLIRTYDAKGALTDIISAVARGSLIGCVALTEDCTRLEGNPPKTRGLQQGEACRVTGTKTRAVNAPIAEWIAVAGDVGGKTALFLIPGPDPGLERGRRMESLGYAGLPVSDLRLEECRVPRALVLGPFADDAPLRELRMWEDQILIGASLGLMRRSFDAALIHAKEHRSGGVPIIRYQEVGFKLAEMTTLHQSAQLLAYEAAWMTEAGLRQAGTLTRCAKVFCGESAETIASQAVQIFGGAAFTSGNAALSSYRGAKYIQVSGTSTEISRMNIADGVLRSY